MGMGRVGIKEWSKSYTITPHDNIISHALAKAPKFEVSFAKDPCPPIMSYIMGWEYGRIWLKERDAFKAKRRVMSEPKRIRNDYKWWLDKRKKSNDGHQKMVKDKST